MIEKKHLFIIAINLLLVSLAWGQKPYSYESRIYQDNIYSLQTLVNSEITTTPLIRLNSNDRMVLQFDDFVEEDKEYFYRIIHCDMNWNESDILDVVYLKGFHDEPVDNWEFSNGTIQDYTHYFLQLPNNDTDFAISGNYLILIYQLGEDNKVIPIITQRMLVADTKANLSVKNRFPTDVANLRFKQQMDIQVIPSGINTNNPIREVFVSVLQNGDYNKSIAPTTARNINNGMLQFDPFGAFSFYGNTEFRSFDLRSLNSAGRGVQSIDQNPDGYEVSLFQDQRRDQSVYLLNFDFNGRYYVDNFENIRAYATSSNVSVGEVDSLRSGFRYRDPFPFGQFRLDNKDVTSDYANVSFRLKSQKIVGDVYIYGGLTNWKISDEFKMSYDEYDEEYQHELLLKQAFYDYTYVVKYKDQVDFTTLEGSWADTENDYLILVYARPFGSRYDRLIGFKEHSSATPF